MARKKDAGSAKKVGKGNLRKGKPDKSKKNKGKSSVQEPAETAQPEAGGHGQHARVDLMRALALPEGFTRVSQLDTTGTVGPSSKDEAEEALAELAPRLAELQERLYAASKGGDRRRVLLVLQGMDTAGKDGVIKHVVGLVNPAGVAMTAFKQPTAQELAHDFLWRIEKATPGAGMIGVFNRSQYEDVLVVRVHELVPRATWSRRYAAINAFERRLVRQGTTVVKCFLHVSKQVQKERLAARLEDPTKYWKYNPGDVDERELWDDYQAAYSDALRRCSTLGAPWYVIPADRKWYRNWAVAALLTQVLEQLDPQYPPAGFDLAVERERVASC